MLGCHATSGVGIGVDGVEPVRFRLLGPVSAWRGPAEIDLGPRKHHAVLAALLLHTGHAVSAETVLAAVWGDTSPVDGPNVVQLVADYPLRERFAGQLMEVLHRAGRQSEALAVYRDLRAQLVNELGIEPDQSLARLHERIVAEEPDAADVPPVPATPRQLPLPPGDFTGREH
jgi:DNA-binding SARP family transcriptional activator